VPSAACRIGERSTGNTPCGSPLSLLASNLIMASTSDGRVTATPSSTIGALGRCATVISAGMWGAKAAFKAAGILLYNSWVTPAASAPTTGTERSPASSAVTPGLVSRPPGGIDNVRAG
jgi:hypothetical protein